MTNPMGQATQPPHVPTVIWAVGIAVVILGIYHFIHKH